MLSDDFKCFSFFFQTPETLHAIFNLIDKHHPVFFSAGLLFVFEILRMQTTLSFLSGIFWRSIVK